MIMIKSALMSVGFLIIVCVFVWLAIIIEDKFRKR